MVVQRELTPLSVGRALRVLPSLGVAAWSSRGENESATDGVKYASESSNEEGRQINNYSNPIRSCTR